MVALSFENSVKTVSESEKLINLTLSDVCNLISMKTLFAKKNKIICTFDSEVSSARLLAIFVFGFFDLI
jgi:hypothetical protein